MIFHHARIFGDLRVGILAQFRSAILLTVTNLVLRLPTDPFTYRNGNSVSPPIYRGNLNALSTFCSEIASVTFVLWRYAFGRTFPNGITTAC